MNWKELEKIMSRKKVVIERFMTQVLNLNGNDLVLFAIMWAESDQGRKAVSGDYVGLSGRMNVAIPTLYKCMNKLVEKGYVTKDGRMFNVSVID